MTASPMLIVFAALFVIVVLVFAGRRVFFSDDLREIFVASAGSNAVTVFGVSRIGEVVEQPLRIIQSSLFPQPLLDSNGQPVRDGHGQPVPAPDTGLNDPWDVTVDASGEAYVLSVFDEDQPARISVFRAGASGSVPPKGVYPQNDLQHPTAIILRRSPAGLICACVANVFAGFVMEVPRMPDSGVPMGATGRIDGPDSRIQTPAGITFDGQGGGIYVTEPTQNAVLMFEAHHPFEDSHEAPTRVISGPHTLLDQPQRIALGPRGEIFVTNRGNGSITIYAADAAGDAAPLRRIGGPDATHSLLAQPMGIDVDATGQIYVADGNNLLVFDKDADGGAAPRQVIIGDDTNQLSLPTGVAFHVPPQ